jgi:hypothetical protein
LEYCQGSDIQKWSDFSNTYSINTLPTGNTKTNPINATTISSIPVNSEHILPGVSGQHFITLSVIQKGIKRDFFLGQVQLNLNEDYLWKRGGSFTANLEDVKFLCKDKNGQEIKFDYSATPQGSITFQLDVFHGMNAECGHVLGVAIEDYIRALNKLPPSIGSFIFPRKVVIATEKLKVSFPFYSADYL